MSVKQEQKMVDDWNRECVIGQKVLLRLDDGSEMETYTTDKAMLLGGHTAVGWFHGVMGCYSLERATAV
jgi:hypothetical protein